MALLKGLPSNNFFQRALILFVGITLLINLYFYARETKIVNRRQDTDRNEKWPSQNNESAKKVSIFPSKEPVVNLRRTVRKIFIAFGYWEEQLASATNSFLDLTALAAYGGRQVVVPFVKNSFFWGSPTQKRSSSKTLELYYNVTALNHTLRSRGHGTLISWKEFQDVCHGKLDVLVHFKYAKHSQDTPPFWPCNHERNTFGDFKVERTICMNVFAVDSIAKFENDVVNKLPCVGLSEWRGSNRKYTHRAQFNLSSVLSDRVHSGDAASVFSSNLIHVAQDFIAKNLGTPFYSMHIRSEKILYFKGKVRNVNAVKTCISNLATLVERHKNVSTAHIPIFLAADFTDYGSSSGTINSARKIAELLMNILAPLKPVIFQPSAYNLTDRGAVAIVEMNILVSGKHLFVAGSGRFQGWVVNINKNNIEQKSTTKCQNELCNSLCCL